MKFRDLPTLHYSREPARGPRCPDTAYGVSSAKVLAQEFTNRRQRLIEAAEQKRKQDELIRKANWHFRTATIVTGLFLASLFLASLWAIVRA